MCDVNAREVILTQAPSRMFFCGTQNVKDDFRRIFNYLILWVIVKVETSQKLTLPITLTLT